MPAHPPVRARGAARRRHGRTRPGGELRCFRCCWAWAPIGIRLGRTLQATQLTRDVAHMYALGADFSLAGTQAHRAHAQPGLQSVEHGQGGAAVLAHHESPADRLQRRRAAYVSQPRPAGVYAAHRDGQPSLRTSQFGTPPYDLHRERGKHFARQLLPAVVADRRRLQFRAVARAPGSRRPWWRGTSAMPDINFLDFPDRGEDIMFASCFRPGPAPVGTARAPRICAVDRRRHGAAGAAAGRSAWRSTWMMYLVQLRLSAASDAAALAGARALSRGSDDAAQRNNAETTANALLPRQFSLRVLLFHQSPGEQRGGHRLDLYAVHHHHGQRRPAVPLPARADAWTTRRCGPRPSRRGAMSTS